MSFLPLNRLQFFFWVRFPPNQLRVGTRLSVSRLEGCKRRERTVSERMRGGQVKGSDRKSERPVSPLRRLEEQRSEQLSPMISACHSRQGVLKLSPSNCRKSAPLTLKPTSISRISAALPSSESIIHTATPKDSPQQPVRVSHLLLRTEKCIWRII